MGKKVYTDNDMYFAMLKSMNEDMNIDGIHVEVIESMAEKEEIMRWWGMVYNFNGLDVKNLENPVFSKK